MAKSWWQMDSYSSFGPWLSLCNLEFSYFENLVPCCKLWSIRIEASARRELGQCLSCLSFRPVDQLLPPQCQETAANRRVTGCSFRAVADSLLGLRLPKHASDQCWAAVPLRDRRAIGVPRVWVDRGARFPGRMPAHYRLNRWRSMVFSHWLGRRGNPIDHCVWVAWKRQLHNYS